MSSKEHQRESVELPPGKACSNGGSSNALPTESGGVERPRRWDSETLLAGLDEAWITHGDETYRLRRTRNGKLILVK